jgi:excisionase family DNA binding protein
MHSYRTAPPQTAAEPSIRPPFKVAEVALMLGVHKSTIYRDIQEGSLRALRVGTGKGALRIRPEHLDAYMALLEVRAVEPTTAEAVAS